MPLKINGDINSLTKASKQIYSAKFFSKDITGSGKAAGLLNQSMFPVNLSANTPINSIAPKWDISSEFYTYLAQFFNVKTKPAQFVYSDKCGGTVGTSAGESGSGIQ